MNLIEKTGHSALYNGLGASDRSLIGEINEAILSVLCGVSEKRQIELMDRLVRGELSFELQ
jgi:hypothetical protein